MTIIYFHVQILLSQVVLLNIGLTLTINKVLPL